MKVKDEINKYASEEDKPVLLWLFSRYHMQSQWNFVAFCTFERYGNRSWAHSRIWAPTYEGRILYEAITNKEKQNQHKATTQTKEPKP